MKKYPLYCRPLAICLIWLVCAISVFSLSIDLAEAAPKVTGTCKAEMKKWRGRGGYGAFAMSSNGWCGYSWNSPTLAQAKQSALAQCSSSRKSKNCQIVALTDTPGTLVKESQKCDHKTTSLDASVRIAACTGLILSGRDKGNNLAWDYVERGINYKQQGKLDLALEDFESAVNVAKKYPWSYLNRSWMRRDAGDLDSALQDAKTALKLLPKKEATAISDTKTLITDIESRLREASTMKDDLLCTRALDTDRANWDQRPNFVHFSKEAQKRSFAVGDCRVALGFSRVRNPTESYSVSALCSAALNSTKTDWESRSKAPFARDEADRRSLTIDQCRESVGLVDALAALATDAAKKTDVVQADKIRQATTNETCRFAINDARDNWDQRPAFQASVKEAKQRGFSVAGCRKQLGLPAIELQALLKLDAVPVVATDATPRQDFEKPRYALIIGNANYRNLETLTAPQRDAHALAEVLKALGFQVTELVDADQTAMRRALAAFGQDLRSNAKAGLFYFSGYSAQAAGKNFLLPVDSKIDNADGLKWQSIAFDDVLSSVGDSSAATKIIVLESGWDLRLSQAPTGIFSGLAPVVPPAGSLVSFSNAPGHTPSASNQTPSAYTAALIEAIATSGLSIEEVFKRARASLSKTSGNGAVPWETNALITDFAFKP